DGAFRHHLRAHGHLPHLPCALLHLAPHGLLPHRAPRGGGVRARGRGHPHADAAPHRLAHGRPRHHLRPALLVHALLERVHLRPHLRVAVGEQDGGGGRDRRPHPRGHLLLGLADGGRG